MKKIGLLAMMAVVMMGIAFTSCDSKKSMGSAKLTSDVDSVSFIIGKAQASNMKRQMESWPIKGNIDAFLAGFMVGIDNSDDSLFLGKDEQAANAFINEFFRNMQNRVANDNKAEGDKFLAENKTKSGVITTPSGLQYKVITEGTGPKPAAIDTVVVHYIGKYLDGTEFDSSIGRGEPISFPLNGVIAGWTEGLQLMPVGSKYTLWIPTELAYGQNNPNIKPNSTLEFEVELLEVKKAK
ncbi:MAG: FKBP-type peptidyl-prolyl cis-trans isomerase [Tannerella sp.]|jgi:FKBP-type peptidyl-prolyl cis-trans isomerase|nr:FKBP-type peptidyl-prolyl cis-trans isomerase [Tannerella sp.]